MRNGWTEYTPEAEASDRNSALGCLADSHYSSTVSIVSQVPDSVPPARLSGARHEASDLAHRKILLIRTQHHHPFADGEGAAFLVIQRNDDMRRRIRVIQYDPVHSRTDIARTPLGIRAHG